MTSTQSTDEDAGSLARQLAGVATERGLSVAVAESLTCGRLSCVLGSAPDTSTWLRGGVVAYAPEVKFKVLGVPPGPVVTPECALSMARGVANLLEAELAVAVTGVGGPVDEEGQPPGTVWFGLVSRAGEHVEVKHFAPDDPDEVLTATTEHAVRLLADWARR